MASISRPLADAPLRFTLPEEAARLARAAQPGHGGRSARTLVKEGDLRVTLIALEAGGRIAPHHSAGPITVQVLSGSVRFAAGGEESLLAEGDLLSLPPAVEHEVRSDGGGVFLLTLVAAVASAKTEAAPAG